MTIKHRGVYPDEYRNSTLVQWSL